MKQKNLEDLHLLNLRIVKVLIMHLLTELIYVYKGERYTFKNTNLVLKYNHDINIYQYISIYCNMKSFKYLLLV